MFQDTSSTKLLDIADQLCLKSMEITAKLHSQGRDQGLDQQNCGLCSIFTSGVLSGVQN